MKKLLVIEIIVLVILVAVAIVVCSDLGQKTDVPPVTTTTESTWETSTETIQNTSSETTQLQKVPQVTWKTFPDRALTCKQFFVYDCSADVLTAQYGDGNKLYPASITKLFTAYTALQYLAPTAKVVAGKALDLVSANSSIAYIQPSDVLTVEQLVEAMLLPSGNDAAYLIAVAAGRELAKDPELDAVEAAELFVEKMNSTAQQVGMTGSHFVNPDGYHDDDHYMCFADLAILGKLALENETIVRYVNMSEGNNPNHDESLSIPQWKNTNALIQPESEYYCSYARGLKTGQTSQAGKCLLSAFDYEGRKLIIGVFGCPKPEDRFADTLHIFSRVIGAVE